MTHAEARQRSPGGAWALPTALHRVLLLGPPLALAVLEIFHPQPDVNAQAVMDVATWFALFHAIQLVLIGLTGLSVILLADSFGRAAAWTTRLGVGAFLVFFSAYDGIAGISTGLAMRNARDLPPEQVEGVWVTVKDWPGFDPAVFSLNIVGSLGWVVAVGALAFAARRLGAPRTQWILIGLAALFLMGGHPSPFGTLAFGAFFVAGLLRERELSRPARAPAAPEQTGPSEA
jgi:hypothetical protein